ncbi:glycine--tRNA ligase subunit beta [Ferviditalea candida]|uniref:Glycine--tRNA ligase beta subunit n=1 Tax=Ferviditalea candida TaxID=3108399 RepID=A0ABU5ZG62_9BACL|nr:glycine--tRNA ligase subunit beta [Paenibacillaceae bacterium T2]
MAKHLLFEIGMEEIPARFIRGAVELLQQKVEKWLNDSRIAYGKAEAFATPRRIAVSVSDVAEKQEDLQDEVKGPSKKIALDEQGNWSKAALGFARSQDVNPEQLFFKELSGVEYVHAVKSKKGVPAEELFGDGLKEIVQSMAFPKNMRWGSHDLRFVRPIRWIVALFGEQIIPLEITGVRSGRMTKGHRFLGQDVSIPSASEYAAKLREQFVIADMGERASLIAGQIEGLAKQKGWHVSMKEDLLEEVLFLVEYPTVLYGTFDPDFLNIPQEVLITSMREHQRYFPVMDGNGKLLPYFITVRNGNDVSLDQVAKGNEKVLRARLSDAKFFYQEDQKMKIDAALARLETIVFHEELGTLGDKVRRIGRIAEEIAGILRSEEQTLQDVRRTAAICKFDLVTLMVYEFPELQGIMGEDYARKAGEKEAVARAIFEHYQPRFSGDAVPASLVGSIVSMADKIDTIAACFSIGIIPTGSQDPYALRRQAAGIVQILHAHRLPIRLADLFDTALSVLEQAGLLKRERNEIMKDLMDFFALRVKNIFPDTVRYDIVDAVMSGGFDDVSSVVRRGEALMDAVNGGEFKSAVDSFVRVGNLAAKADESREIDSALFQQVEEHVLHDAWRSMRDAYLGRLANFEESQALERLSSLKEPIRQYFDAVMVMVDDDALRRARLALLRGIADDIRRFADFQKIVW